MPPSRSAHRPGSPPRRSAEEYDLRPTGRDGSRPPRLQLHLVKRLKFVLLVNALPLVAGTIITWLWVNGSITFGRFSADELLGRVLILLASLVVVGLSWWVLIPVARWGRDYPMWYFRHESRLIWALPAALGWLTWVGLYVLSAFLTIVSLLVLVLGLWQLAMRVLA
jgi:hypothetical protein